MYAEINADAAPRNHMRAAEPVDGVTRETVTAGRDGIIRDDANPAIPQVFAATWGRDTTRIR